MIDALRKSPKRVYLYGFQSSGMRFCVVRRETEDASL